MEIKGVCNMTGLYSHLKHRSLFTRPIIEAANTIVRQIQKNELKPGDTYQGFDILHCVQSLIIPALGSNQKLILNFSSYQSLAIRLDKNENSIDLEDLVLFKAIAVNKNRHDLDRLCYVKPNKLVKWTEWRGEWERSEHYKLLISLVTKHANQLRNVDQISCFALGFLHADYKRRPYIQHLAACTIRDTMNTLHHKKIPELQILAQDPAYCSNCISQIGEIGIKTVTDLSGFFRVTENTFVICIAPSGPVLQIIADLMADCGGPRAILCDTIEDGLELDGMDVTLTHDNEPTRNMLAYRDRYNEEVFSDDIDYTEIYGNDKHASELKNSAQTMYEDLWTELEPPIGAQVCKSEAKDKIPGLLKHVNDYHSRKFRVNFGDLRLYVKKD